MYVAYVHKYNVLYLVQCTQDQPSAPRLRPHDERPDHHICFGSALFVTIIFRSSMTSQSLLSCQRVLAPPLSSIGADEAMIEYSSNSLCWHVSFSSDGELLAACYGAPDCCARIWELENFTLVATLKDLHTRTVRCCSFAPVAMNYTLATSSFDGTIGIWEKGKDDRWDCIAQLEGHESECKCVEWNAASTLLATCGRDKTVWLWDCSLEGNIGGGDGEFECLAVLNGHEGDIKSVVFAPSRGQFGDGDEICLSGSYDNTVRVWAEDAGDWYCALVLTESHTIWSLAFAPGATRLIIGSADASIGVYKLYTSQEQKLVVGEQSQQLSST